MVILGLGANLGDRLANLRKALDAISALPLVTVQQVSPLYLSDALLPEDAPADWDMPHLNYAIRCDTTLTPTAFLKQLKEIEWSIGRKPIARHWGPRLLDIDILAWDDVVIETDALTVPHRNLIDRPFALWPLADVAPFWRFPLPGESFGKTAAELVEKWGSRFSGEAPLRTRQLNQLVKGPQIVGVINVTPDSFSDGGKFLVSDVALQHTTSLVEDGAEIIDIGSESTSPRAEAIDEKTEWQRLQPILTAIIAAKSSYFLMPKISVDTRHAFVAEKAIELGVDWINDVSGLDDKTMRDVVRSANVNCVVMHHVHIPERRDRVLKRAENPVALVLAWASERLSLLEKEGFDLEKIIFDPGIGFGKMAEQSLDVIKNIDAFSHLPCKILVGHSRKTFLSLLSNRPFAERDIETTAISIYLAKKNVDYLRVHDVNMCARALKVTNLLSQSVQALRQPYEMSQTR